MPTPPPQLCTNNNHMTRQHLIGQKFGRWTVIDEIKIETTTDETENNG